ncbi:MAG: hypothetical protein GC159_05010 [Phycisphaera sp.]|nr:hypothetical protein [Phycisphaera sp.]
MRFRWNEWNLDHVQEHGVSPDEAESVVVHARRPFPLQRGDGKQLVWGRGDGGRWIQIVFLTDDDATIYVIHGRPLDEREKRRLRRMWR